MCPVHPFYFDARRRTACPTPKEPLNTSSTERVTSKIGMITRHATQVVVGSTMPTSVRGGAPDFNATRPDEASGRVALSGSSRESPQSAARGARELEWDAAGMWRPRLWINWACIPLRGRIPFVVFRASHPTRPSGPSGIYAEVPQVNRV